MRVNEWDEITEIIQNAIKRLDLSKEEVIEILRKIEEEEKLKHKFKKYCSLDERR